MGNLTAGMLAQLSTDHPSFIPVFAIDLPDGTTRMFCRAGGGSIHTSYGTALPRILQFGTLRYALGDRRGGVPGVTANLVLEDHDNFFQSLIGTYGKQALWYSTCRILGLADSTTGLAQSDNVLLFNGLLESWTKSARREFQLSLRVNDLWLKSSVTKEVYRIEDFPYINQALMGKVIPQVWGVHDSNGTGKWGAIELDEVDATTHTYAISQGVIGLVRRVYTDPVAGSLASAFTLSTQDIGGKYYSLVTGISPTPSAGQKITADVEGLVDASALLITNPITMLRYILVNFGFGKGYKSGALMGGVGSAPIDSTSFTAAETYVGNKAMRASRRFSEATTVDSVIAEFCVDYGMRAYWTMRGNLGIVPRTHILPSGTRTWIKWDRDGLKPPSFPDEGVDGYATHFLGRYCYQEAQQKYFRTLEVENFTIPDARKVTEDLEFRASFGSLGY